MNQDSPAAAPLRPRRRRLRALRRPVRPPLVPAGHGHRRVPGGGRRPTASARSRSRRRGAGSSTATARCSSTTASPCRSRSTARCWASSTTRQRTEVLDAAGRRRWPAPGSPRTVEQLEARIADQRYSPYVPVPVAGDVPEELKIWIDEHARRAPVGRRRAGGRAALPLRSPRRPRARLHGQDHQGGVRRRRRTTREAVHAQRRDREVRRRADLRGRPARHAGHHAARGRRRRQHRSA